jgi:hypothetical protein
MKVNDKVHGSAILRENDLERKYIRGIERKPKIKGIIRRSLSGFVNG